MGEACKDCPHARDGRCKVSGVFMSDEDCAFHRAVFSRSYSVALVLGESPAAGLTWKLFSWRHGVIVPRGFTIVGNGKPVKEPVASEKGGDVNATSLST